MHSTYTRAQSTTIEKLLLETAHGLSGSKQGSSNHGCRKKRFLPVFVRKEDIAMCCRFLLIGVHRWMHTLCPDSLVVTTPRQGLGDSIK